MNITTKQFLDEVELKLNNIYEIEEQSPGMYGYKYKTHIGRLTKISNNYLTLDCSDVYYKKEITINIEDINKIKLIEEGDED